jgi:hypothetical protein
MKTLAWVTVSIAALFLATGTAPASATWGNVWKCGKIKVTKEWSPGGNVEPSITFDGKHLPKRLYFKHDGHMKAKLNGKLCKFLPDEGWI